MASLALNTSLVGTGTGGVLYCCATPLDFSFKELKNCSEVETEEPRSGGFKRRVKVDNDAATVGQGDAVADPLGASSTVDGKGALGVTGKTGTVPHMRRAIRKVNVAVKMNNNCVETLQDLPQALVYVMDDPLRNLLFVDISFNMISAIEPVLLQFQMLKALYLHGNMIKSLPSVERLKGLPNLISLTLNGNPIEGSRSYRHYCIGALSQIRTLDHSAITAEETAAGQAWFNAHRKRLKARKDRMEEAYLNSLND